MIDRRWIALPLVALVAATSAVAEDKKPDAALPGDLAAKFGAREGVIDISLSPDGRRIALVAPGRGTATAVRTLELGTNKLTHAGGADGKPLSVRTCGWASATRLVCKLSGVAKANGLRVGYSRTMGVDWDGKNPVYLGRKAGVTATRANQFDGDVIDWRGGDGAVLMTRDWVPEGTDAGFGRQSRDGLGVDLVNAATGRGTVVEPPRPDTSAYIADGQGNVRIRADDDRDEAGVLSGLTTYSYRPGGATNWRTFSRVRNGDGLVPIAVDGTRNVAFAVKSLDGRDALYSVALDGSMKTELASSNPAVDVRSVVSIGRRGRVIGATYVTDRRQIDYFDPEYRKLAASLRKALPHTPSIYIVGADANERTLLIFAGSDTDPGCYYLFDKTTRHLDVVAVARPELEKMTMAAMQPITFPAADGTQIPGYLTLPPGGARTGLPAIVMPHGGPAARDEWGFDWLVQYFAQAGYVVLQPEYRGSTGYGDAWYAQNGFKSWQIAIGDVLDAGRWLVKQGIAAPKKLGIVGWSYGGYAALQANVVDPDLFKAVVAVAPVTDLGMLKQEAEGFNSQRLVARQIGSGAALAQGSPARHADRFKAPVLLFHGDQDINVGIGESKAMDNALHKAGKRSTFVMFPGLDHQLDDDTARSRLLGEATTFLRKAMEM